MVIEHQLDNLSKQLNETDQGFIEVGGMPITVKALDEIFHLLCSTPVYSGGNYIPKSVRASLSSPPRAVASPRLSTFLKIDEENFQVNLHYRGHVDYFDMMKMRGVLQEFSDIAREWQLYLDEQGRHDLVYVYKK